MSKAIFGKGKFSPPPSVWQCSTSAACRCIRCELFNIWKGLTYSRQRLSSTRVIVFAIVRYRLCRTRFGIWGANNHNYQESTCDSTQCNILNTMCFCPIGSRVQDVNQFPVPNITEYECKIKSRRLFSPFFFKPEYVPRFATAVSLAHCERGIRTRTGSKYEHNKPMEAFQYNSTFRWKVVDRERFFLHHQAMNEYTIL